ncbi:hypothetical protein POV26_00300, partial [Aequorivita todarodis]|nr:hypothetical protein [Aequorivita todarodis]
MQNNAVDPSPITIDTGCQILQGTRTIWFRLAIMQATNFTFQIEPTGNVDYDFAVWVNADCNNLGVADRASYDAPSAGEYDTGLNLTATDFCETAVGDGQVQFLSLVPGDEVIIVVDRFSNTPDIFNLTFGDPDAFDCSIVQTSACDGETVILDATTPNALGYEWFYENPIGSGIFFPFVPAETSPTLSVTTTGYYKADIFLPGGVTDSEHFDVVFYPQPIIASPPLDLSICDDGTNPGIFDLTENDDDVRGGQDPLFEITYHHNQLDAMNDSNPIIPANAYPIVGSSEIIWVRIEEPSGTCYAIDSFEISFAAATATAPASPHYLCDVGVPGQESIDLNTTFDAVILNGQNPAQYTVTYHANPADAIAGINPLPQPHVVTGSEFIFARVESNTVPSCYATTQFNLVLAPQPIANPPVNLYQCDYGTTAGVFNLRDNDANILGGQDPALFTIKYYQTYQDSFDDTNEILGGVHIIVPPSPQTIYARIEDNTGSCFDLTDFKIYFSRAIAGLVPVSASYCDADGDGGEWVDLAAEFNALVLDGEPSSRYNITYHG